MRKRFLEGFHYDAHPMGMLVSSIAALSTFYPDAKEIDDPAIRNKQIVRLIAKMPTLAAACHRFSVGMPFVYPDNSLGFTENFLSMLWKVAEPRYDAEPRPRQGARRALHPARRPRAELRHHGDAHGRLGARRPLRRARRRPPAALYGPRHGGANEAVIHMLTEIGIDRRTCRRSSRR